MPALADRRRVTASPNAVLLVMCVGYFLVLLDATIVNVALPTIGRDFSVSPTAVDSVSIAYLVSLAVFIPASGWLGDRFGGKRVLLTAIAVFSVASALCGVASSLGELVAFRVLQGAGGGMLAPVVTPWVGQQFGWGYAVGLGGVVCLIGVALWFWIDPCECPAEASDTRDPAGN